jgi:hypothetical protein
VATVSIGSNKKYAEGWDAVFKKGKTAKKKQSSSKTTAKAKKARPARKKTSSQKPARKSARKG